ncbi:MAG: hypothetical protein ACJA08_000092 [Cyclobacteriaceae bacterium]|jgi:hypothetical protein
MNSRRFFTLATTGSTPLPIELLDFRAIAIDKDQVSLEWETVSEMNNDFFTLERSIDGIQWGTITTIDVAGTTTELRRYQYVDRQRGLEIFTVD